MSEPTQTMNAEKRQVDETEQESRAPFPITPSSHSRSSRPDEETNEQLTHSSKQARITKTRGEAPQDVFVLFLQTRMADTRGGNEKRMLMMKDEERKLYFVSCPPEMQTAPRETRRVVWDTQMSFNAVVILTDEETRQLTDASRETYPMQRVDTDQNAHLRGGNDYFCVAAKHKGLDMETSRQRKDFGQILLLVMWIATIYFAVGMHKLTSPFTHAISRTNTPKDKKSIESCCIAFRKKETHVEQFFGFAST